MCEGVLVLESLKKKCDGLRVLGQSTEEVRSSYRKEGETYNSAANILTIHRSHEAPPLNFKR